MEEEMEKEDEEREEAGISYNSVPIYPSAHQTIRPGPLTCTAPQPQLCGIGDQHHPDSKLLSPLLQFAHTLQKHLSPKHSGAHHPKQLQRILGCTFNILCLGNLLLKAKRLGRASCMEIIMNKMISYSLCLVEMDSGWVCVQGNTDPQPGFHRPRPADFVFYLAPFQSLAVRASLVIWNKVKKS